MGVKDYDDFMVFVKYDFEGMLCFLVILIKFWLKLINDVIGIWKFESECYIGE